MKRILQAMVCFCCLLTPLHVKAEGEYSDTTYWSNYCSQQANVGTSACKGYIEYLSEQSKQASESLKEIEAQREQIAADLEKYDAQLKEYQSQIETKQVEINDMQAKIDAKQVEIDIKQASIDETQSQVDALKEKIKSRMENQQSGMRIPQYLDIIMGAKSFTDFIRIMNGLSAISQSDQAMRDELIALIDQLNEEKAALEKDKEELVTQQNALVEAQNSLIILREQTQVIIEEQEKKAAMLEAEGNKIASNIEEIKATLKKVDLNVIVSAAGWTFPVPGSYRSAGTWHYSGGGVHLGYDFAAAVGSNIVSVGNGVVIHRADGCPTYGGLGSTCGSQYGGSTGGGNQVYMLVNVNGNLYAVKYLHMMQGTPIAVGTMISAGDVIGRLGSSGNSSGPHCHIEIFYLGEGSSLSSYAASWNGDLAFGAGWAGSYGGYGRTCESGYGAPCRIRPESVFGG